MSIRKLLFSILGTTLSAFLLPANAQMADQAARERALNVVRAELHLTADKFLQARRDEGLEQTLATVVARPSWSEFIYRISPEGDEIKENAIVHHIFTDVDPMYIIAVGPTDGTAFRIRGFADSLAEFEKLMTAAKVRVSSPDQAEAVASFYREIDPERRSLVPISRLIELKQAAERQCQTSSFDASEKAFNAWWKQAKPLYAAVPFQQTATPSDSGYLVEWVVLSSAAKGNCGGAPLRARFQVSSDGHVGEPTFSPLQKPSH